MACLFCFAGTKDHCPVLSTNVRFVERSIIEQWERVAEAAKAAKAAKKGNRGRGKKAAKGANASMSAHKSGAEGEARPVMSEGEPEIDELEEDTNDTPAVLRTSRQLQESVAAPNDKKRKRVAVRNSPSKTRKTRTPIEGAANALPRSCSESLPPNY